MLVGGDNSHRSRNDASTSRNALASLGSFLPNLKTHSTTTGGGGMQG